MKLFRKILGFLLLASPMIAVIAAAAVDMGVLVALAITGIALVVVGVIFLGCFLVDYDS